MISLFIITSGFLLCNTIESRRVIINHDDHHQRVVRVRVRASSNGTGKMVDALMLSGDEDLDFVAWLCRTSGGYGGMLNTESILVCYSD